jgi:glucosamine--fructose-6-phosphate aminotransferase (isomerizing)
VTTRMRDEIGEIPAVVDRVLREGAAPQTAAAAAVRAANPAFAVIAARGTSDHAGVYARYLLETQLGLSTGLAAPSVVTLYDARVRWNGAVVIGLSQSGQSPDVSQVLSAAGRTGALTIAVTNDPSSPLAGAADFVLDCHAGVERSVAATKTYVAELAVVASLVGHVSGDGEMRERLEAMPDALRQTLAAGETWLNARGGPLAAFTESDRSVVVSRGHNMATALEIALKLKETTATFAEGYSTADLLHGPMVLAGPGVPALAVRPAGPVGDSLDDVLGSLLLAGSRVWTIGAAPRAVVEGSAPLPPGIPEPLTPLCAVVPGQLLAEAVSRGRGLDPDQPVGLSKVTRTW